MSDALYPSLKPLKVEKDKPVVEAPGFKGQVRASDYERRLFVKGTWKKEKVSK